MNRRSERQNPKAEILEEVQIGVQRFGLVHHREQASLNLEKAAARNRKERKERKEAGLEK